MKDFFIGEKLSNLMEEKVKLENEYSKLKSLGLKINMARGIPSPEQISLSNSMLDTINSDSDFKTEEGLDCRNYGLSYGIPEARRFFANLMRVKEDMVIVGGNSSLEIMFDTISMFMTQKTKNCNAWIKQKEIKFLCPTPGYDRHFRICEYFGIKMINIKMTPEGPDMDRVEKIVESDETVKGIWCVPKFSNPQGISYSNKTIKRIANLKPKAKDFKVFWDNAYIVHDLTEENTDILNIIDEASKNNNHEMPIVFCSLSKVTFAGSAVAAVACMGENLSELKLRYSVKSVGPDKLNQLRHIRFLKDNKGILSHMKKHRKILKPKFDIVINALKKHFEGSEVKWENPKGGYFVSVDLPKNCAKRTCKLCKEAGVTLTDAGATYPYGLDQLDSNIRIAPSFPSCDELAKAMEVFCTSAKIAYLETLLK